MVLDIERVSCEFAPTTPKRSSFSMTIFNDSAFDTSWLLDLLVAPFSFFTHLGEKKILKLMWFGFLGGKTSALNAGATNQAVLPGT